MIGGAADIAFTNTLTFSDAVAKGMPLEAVAAAEVYDSAAPLIRLLTLPNSPIANAADLNGKTIGVPGLHDEAWIATMAWVDEHGGDSKTLHFVEIPPTLMQSALRAGRVDAVTIFDPFAAQMVASGMRTLGDPGGAFASRYMDTEWVAKRSWLAAHPVAAARFERVMSAASAYCTAHFKQLVPFMATFSKMPVASLEASAPEQYGRRVRAALLQPVIDEAVKYNHIKPFLASQVIFHAPEVSTSTGS